jgi:hypothetical protein
MKTRHAAALARFFYGAVYWTSRDFVFVTGNPDFPLTVKIVRRAGQGRPVEYEMVEYEIRKRSWHD